MKNCYTLLLLTIFHLSTFAAPVIKAQSNSYWGTASTWNLQRLPQAGDTIEIPKGITVVVNDDESINGFAYIRVYGVLAFEELNSTLKIKSGVIEVSGGFINGGGSASQKITIGNTIIFKGNEPSISGFQIASSAAPYFAWIMPTPLPVKYISFKLTHSSGNVQVQWSTATEINTDHFEVERSFDGNTWTSIVQLKAAGNSVAVNNYNYTDKSAGSGIVYYRVKDVDMDGRISLTEVKSINSQSNGAVRIYSAQSKVMLQFASAVNSGITVRIVSINGQVVKVQNIDQPAGQVVLDAGFKGNCFVAVSNGKDINIARQVIL